MKNARESILLASLIIGILLNGLLFSVGWWRNYTLIQEITLWIAGTPMFAYCFYKFLKAVAKGGKNADKRKA